MKLPIKKKWFDKIKNHNKKAEFRDAHITFVCEETNEELRVPIISTSVLPRRFTREIFINRREYDREEFDDLFEDDYQIRFMLGGRL